MKKNYLVLCLVLFIFTTSYGQTKSEKQKIISKTNVKVLQDFAEKSEKKYKEEKEKALKLAKQKGWVVREDKDGVLKELMRVTDDGTPIYYVTYNVDAAISTRANTLHNGGSLGLNVEGQNMTAHVWDGGLARTTHQEYDGIGGNNRFSIGDGTTTLHYHSAHVTGTIIASGVDAKAKGMAPQASAIGYEWNNDMAEVTTAASEGMLLSNHSYGWNAVDIDDAWFGQYGSDAVDWDNILYNAPYYLMVVAAGNDGDDNTSNGAPLDGNTLFDKLSSHATAKNNLVVANAQDAVIEGEELVSLEINSSSSEGPTDDYRIKPDITGNGTGLYSSYEDADDSYNSISGTSMASPNVCGTLLLLQQHYNNLNSNFMKAATLKGLALHTADDAGTEGPDAIFGWGLLNARQAARTITNNGDETVISELSLNDGGSYSIDVVSDGLTDFVVSISWTDPAGTVNSGTNSSTPALVNDLDVRVTQSSNTYYPYRLTSITTNANDGDNIVDPYEKIIIPAASGTYTINVTHKGSLSGGSQDYSLIVTGCQGTPTAPTANFNANSLAPMVTTETVGFYDLSENLPTSWSWSFSPTTVSYVDGTYATSQNPKVRFNATGLYEVILTATNAQGTDTETKTDYINVTSNCTQCYSYGNTDYATSITGVVFNTINTSTGKSTDGNGNAYSDYTGISTTVTAGNSYDLTTRLNTDGSYLIAAIAWIDWNQDCDFDDPGEEYQLGTAVGVTDGATSNCPLSITVPTTAIAGSTIMRVSCNYDSPGGPCDGGLDGEVEDYTVNVINTCADPSDLIVAGITTTTADLFWTNNSSATNWDIEWGTSPYTFTGTPTENDVTSNPYTLSSLSASTSYDFYVRADCGSDNTNVSDWAGPYNFTTTSLPPSISSVDIDNFYKDKGAEIVISGTYLLNATSVNIGGTAAVLGENIATSLTVTFPPGAYANNTLTVTTAAGSDTYTMNLSTRNSITVGGGTDSHTTIQAALDGLYSWKGTGTFISPVIIEVYSGTYNETVTPNVNLSPTGDNQLIIQNHTGEAPIINATGLNNGMYIGNLDNVIIKGFTVYGATNDNVYSEGDNTTISLVKSYDSDGGSGININGVNSTITNNLCYGNSKYGIHVNGSNNIIKNNTTDNNGGNYSPATVTLIDEGFEGTFEPAGWQNYKVGGASTSNNLWQKGAFTGPLPGPDGSANYALIIYDAAKIVNSALETKDTDLTGYGGASLEYYIYNNGNWGDETYVEISTDGGGSVGTWTNIATHVNDETNSFGGWSPLQTINISAYVGNTINIRFRYSGKDCNSVAVDVVKITATPSAVKTGAGLYVESGTGLTVQNNIFVAKSGDNNYYALKTETGITANSNYNTYYTTNTSLFDYNGTVDNTGPTGLNDLISDPLFVGSGNYHLQSTKGSYSTVAKAPIWPPDVVSGGEWSVDGFDSPAIDAGNPADDFSKQPSGSSAINQGTYGNTPQAARSPGFLPIELFSFKAKYNNSSVVLNWVTASELNNDYFTVERSTNAVDFQAIRNVEGAGNSNNILNYEITDANPPQGVSYYRLKQTDFNGKYSYSYIVSVNKGNDNIFEKPFNYYVNNQFLYIKLNENYFNMTIAIADIAGRKIFNKNIPQLVKSEKLKINIGKLEQGFYNFILFNNTKKFGGKFIIR